jgi:hypothetical protein
MTSRRENKEKTSRKETFSSQAGGEKQRETPITRVAKIVEIVGTSNRAEKMLHWLQSKKQGKRFGEYVESK